MGLEKKVYSFRFEESLISTLKDYAGQENRTLSNFIETLLKEYVVKRTEGEADNTKSKK